jgi:hypothetical protein
LAPCAASARAMAKPIPDVEPVTSADFPCNMRISDECDVGSDSSRLRPELAKECGQLFAAVQYQITRLGGNAFFGRSAIS